MSIFAKKLRFFSVGKVFAMNVFIVMVRVLLLMTLGIVFGSDGYSQGTGGGKSVVVEPMSGGFGFAIGKKLSDLSRDDNAEAYPCLTIEGLRLYYVTGNPARIMLARRTSSTEPFSDKVQMGLDIPGLSGVWINAEETELYVSSGMSQQVFVCRLSFPEKKFVKDKEIVLRDSNGVTSVAPGFLGSVSLSGDKSELYLYHEYLGCISFRRGFDGNYVQSDYVERPSGFRLEGCQLSRDGLRLIVSAKDSTKGSSYRSLYTLKREKVGEKFRASSFALLLDGEKTKLNMYHATISENYHMMVYTGNKDEYWEGNDLYLSYNVIDGIAGEDEAIAMNRVFPHPFEESFRVKVDGYLGGKARLIGIEGVVLAEQELSSAEIEFDMGGYGSGIYIVELSHGGKRLMLAAVKR